ncbi:hypothetical protein A2U01_0042793, partial [Trifolium medium]|nr:hypothetical protein [Trifolium medium]
AVSGRNLVAVQVLDSLLLDRVGYFFRKCLVYQVVLVASRKALPVRLESDAIFASRALVLSLALARDPISLWGRLDYRGFMIQFLSS